MFGMNTAGELDCRRLTLIVATGNGYVVEDIENFEDLYECTLVAAYSGCIDTYRRLHEQMFEGHRIPRDNCVAAAIASGNLELFKYVLVSAVVSVVGPGNITDADVSRAIRMSRPCEMERYGLVAARFGQLDVLKLVYDVYPWRTQHDLSQLMKAASAGGHLHVIKWLLTDREITEYVDAIVESAALTGQLVVLKWLNDAGYLRIHQQYITQQYASMGQQQHILQWLDLLLYAVPGLPMLVGSR
jgi:hypothetical protein